MSEPAQPQPFLRIRDLTKKFGAFTALANVSFDVDEGEFVCFLGPSGCGKTTLLRTIAGLEIQSHGRILQAGEEISALPPAMRDFGIVFQSYALFPNLNIERNVAYGLENSGSSRGEVAARVTELLELVGLSDQRRKYPAQLSGGQQQRVAVARALATSPSLLLLDEPLSALDAKVRVYLRHEIKALQERLGVTTIMVTHDQEEALSMADRIVVMNQGVIEQVGTPTEIYRQPASLFVADFIGEMNSFDAMASHDGTLGIGHTPIVTHGPPHTPGDSMVVIIRPEDIVLRDAGDLSDPCNCFEATVSELEFLGAYWRVSLECPRLAREGIIAIVSVNAVRDMQLDEGMALMAQLPPQRLHVFRASEKDSN